MSEKKFQVYKSSAGSGKTFTLVREFLRIVILNPGLYRNILAITFTNKAANEMKNRIVGSLVSLSKPTGQWPAQIYALIDPIKTGYGLSDETIRKKAEMVLNNILHNYSDLSATTIDSFMQRIIRTFSLDLNLPQNYEVELDVDMLRQRAVDRLIDQAGSNKELTELLVRFLETKTEDDKSWRIENDLNNAAKSLFKEDGILQREALKSMDFADYQKYYGKMMNWISDLESKLNRIGTDALLLLKENGLEITDFTFGKSGVMGYYLKLAENRISDIVTPGARVLTAINEGAWTKAKQQQSICDSVGSIAPHLIDHYNASRELIENTELQYNLYKLLAKHIYPLAVLGSIEAIVEEIREDEKTLPISEFNRIIAGVTQTEATPYIYERLGEKYHHLMIDEFQDTSVLQWQNLLPLVDNALAENHMNLVVGDAKQAIYRWRSGEVDQFIALPHLYGDQTPLNKLRAQNLINHYEDQVLPVNWRSHKAIVEFNNQFFNHLANRLAPAYKPVYESLNQQHNPNKTKGYVQVAFFDPNDDVDEKMLESIPELINKLASEKFKQRDIAILCRTNKQGSAVARYLLEKGIHVISPESLLLGFANNVKLIVCMLRIAADAKDQLAYVEVLTLLRQIGLFGAMPLNDLINKVLIADEHHKVQKQFKLHTFETLLRQFGISFERRQLLQLPLYDMAEELIRIFNMTVQDDIYLQFFLSELHRIVSRKFISINEVLAWWQEKGHKVSVIFPDSLDAVKVMTIHKAKGLEFPVVIFPFAHSKHTFTNKNVWVELSDPLLEKMKTAHLPVQSLGGTVYGHIRESESDKSLLDMVNLLYVAFTRAEERLYILTNLIEDKNTEAHTTPAFIRDFILDTHPDHVFTTEHPWVYSGSVESIREHQDESETQPFFHIQENISTKKWQQNLLISSRSHGQWYDEVPETAIRFGTALHDLLALIRTKDDVEDALDRFSISGELSAKEKKKAGAMLQHLVNHPGLQELFIESNAILAEPEMLLPDGGVIRPDRVKLTEDEVLVAEFKTGTPFSGHKSQLINYMQAIQQTYKQKVRGLLVYASDEGCTIEEMPVAAV
jgi:ATP-dependent exoDNAse (exonuclease V) beta subunit